MLDAIKTLQRALEREVEREGATITLGGNTGAGAGGEIPLQDATGAIQAEEDAGFGEEDHAVLVPDRAGKGRDRDRERAPSAPVVAPIAMGRGGLTKMVRRISMQAGNASSGRGGSGATTTSSGSTTTTTPSAAELKRSKTKSSAKTSKTSKSKSKRPVTAQSTSTTASSRRGSGSTTSDSKQSSDGQPPSVVVMKDTLDREFMESGIDALRRMSAGAGGKGVEGLPSWTITR
jgi:hypothetical protein